MRLAILVTRLEIRVMRLASSATRLEILVTRLAILVARLRATPGSQTSPDPDLDIRPDLWHTAGPSPREPLPRFLAWAPGKKDVTSERRGFTQRW